MEAEQLVSAEAELLNGTSIILYISFKKLNAH